MKSQDRIAVEKGIKEIKRLHKKFMQEIQQQECNNRNIIKENLTLIMEIYNLKKQIEDLKNIAQSFYYSKNEFFYFMAK